MATMNFIKLLLFLLLVDSSLGLIKHKRRTNKVSQECVNEKGFKIIRPNGKSKSCFWLKKRKTSKRDKLCNQWQKESQMMIRDACRKTCNNCSEVPNDPGLPKPNLVMILTDEQNIRTLSTYRNYMVEKYGEDKVDVWGPDAKMSTPNIDSLANEGAMFTNFYTVAPVCTPSRASFMSGMYPHKTGADKNHGRMDGDITTFAQVLNDQGYKTSYLGKWHLDGTEFPGWASNVPEWVSNGRSFGFDENKYRFNRGHWKYFREEGDSVVGYDFFQEELFNGNHEAHYSTDFLFDKGTEFIENSLKSGENFAVVLSIPDPHSPNSIRPPYDTMYKDIHFNIPDTGKRALRRDPAPPGWQQLIADRPDGFGLSMDQYINDLEDSPSSWWQDYMQQYFGMVSCIDDNVGKLMQMLKEKGADDNTIVVFTSDHGEMGMEHGKIEKGSPFETSAKIPLLVRYPAAIPKGKIIETAYSSVDFAPTILDLMGVSFETAGLNSHFEGVKASGDILSDDLNPADDDKIIFSVDYVKGKWASAMMRGYKYIIGRFDAQWLFDLNLDPDEIVNYADSHSHQVIKNKLQTALVEAIMNNLIYYDIGLDVYLDSPQCLDSRDILPLEDGRRKICKDIGNTVSVDICLEDNIFLNFCPLTCPEKCSIDSEGKILLRNGQTMSCSQIAISDTDICSASKKTRTFCPATCQMKKNASIQ